MLDLNPSLTLACRDEQERRYQAPQDSDLCSESAHTLCDGCNKKVKKVLRKIDDAEQGKVTVSGTVDAAILIKKLAKAGKHAELLLPKGGNSVNNTKPQQKENGKPQKGGGGGVGGGGPAAKDPKGQLQQQQLELLQQLKGFKDLKLPPLKDQKNVKFALPLEDGSDFDDELDGDYDDEDDEGFDDIDGFEDDLDADPKQTKQHDFDFLLKGGSAAAGGGGKKGVGGGGVEIPVQFTGGGKKGDKGGGGGDKDAKNGGKSNKGGDKGGNNGNPNKVMGQPGMGVMQGLPAEAPTGMLPPAAAANAYQQQQYMAAMMQQRAMMNGEYGGYPQMGYMRVAPAPPPPPGEPIGNYYYSDENASWCSIM